MKALILGGARSGKSKYAQQLAEQTGQAVVYIATAAPGDDEMRLRIEQHQQDRPASWQLIEEPLDLVSVLESYHQDKVCLLVDCLTLWLSNQLIKDASKVAAAIDALVETVNRLELTLIMVSNEVGMGIVPMGEISRQFVDESGRMHQKLAQVCDQVVMVIAGLPQQLKNQDN